MIEDRQEVRRNRRVPLRLRVWTLPLMQVDFGNVRACHQVRSFILPRRYGRKKLSHSIPNLRQHASCVRIV